MKSVDPIADNGAKESAQSQPPGSQSVGRAGEPAYDLKWDWIIGVACLVIVVLAFALDLNAESHVAAGGHKLPSICWFRNSTGMDCPGCGMTRSFVALAHGRLAEAWDFNPAALLWFAVIAAQIPWRGYRLTRYYFNERHAPTGSAASIAMANTADSNDMNVSEANSGNFQPRSRNWGAIIMLILGAALVLQWIVRFSKLRGGQ